MQVCGFFSLNVLHVSYILPDSARNPRNIQFSLAAAMIESCKDSSDPGELYDNEMAMVLYLF